MRTVWVIVAVFALSGATACLDGSLATHETACANVCSCAPDPFIEQSCNRDCVPLLERFQVSQDCLDCFADLTCPLVDGACDFACGGVPAEELP